MSEHFIPATESDSKYDSLESMGVHDLLTNINQEDQTVPLAVERSIPQIEALVAGILPRMAAGGRLFYIGAGTSGRLGVVDASECPPTFGVAQGVVVGIIAGGDQAIRKAVEFAEDDMNQGWQDLQQLEISENDSLIGIAASGRTPYVLGAIHEAKQSGILTGCISCAPGSPLETGAQLPVTVAVGPEFVTGSTRMKAGTAQKLVLNMISTTLMIKLGRVKGNKMIDMQLANNKLLDRGARMIQAELDVSYPAAADLLKQYGSVRLAIDSQLA